MNRLCALLIAGLVATTPAYAKPDKGANSESAGKGELNVGHQQGKGQPDNPGEHGRENAAQKQRENPGKGSKGGDSRDDLSDKDKDKDKDKGNEEKQKQEREQEQEQEQEKEKNKQKNKNK
jgi:hypothetical protein